MLGFNWNHVSKRAPIETVRPKNFSNILWFIVFLLSFVVGRLTQTNQVDFPGPDHMNPR